MCTVRWYIALTCIMRSVRAFPRLLSAGLDRGLATAALECCCLAVSQLEFDKLLVQQCKSCRILCLSDGRVQLVDRSLPVLS
jgi:hypothetical protein